MAHREHWLIAPTPYASYEAYRKAVGKDAVALARQMTPDVLVEAIHRSGLRGRGGAGFPTGIKWRTLAKHPCPTRYVVCNAAEGEPGTFKDRYLLRNNPYAMLEGLLIAAHVVDAKGTYIAIKMSFVREIERLEQALAEMQKAGVTGSVEVTVCRGPEEYLFGEEKALLSVIEGEGPFPREADDPPYEHGLFATAVSPNPALVNNAQTLALVPGIVRAGADSFRALGTSDTPGTLIVTLSGDIVRPGVYELEAGVTLRQLFHEVGAGPRPGRTLRAAISGVSSGILTADQFDTPADFGSLALKGSGLGSAGFVVFDDQASMPRLTQSVARFLYVESCNQCSACKTDLRIASRSLDRIFDPKTASEDLIERALLGAQHAPQGNRCYLPVEGSAFITSAVRKFRGDFLARLAEQNASDREYLVPKIVDFDEGGRTFSYDPMQPLKQPNWTYLEPPVPSVRKPPPASLPKERATGPVPVRLSPDVGAELRDRAAEEGMDIHDYVDAIVRDWMQAHKKTKG
jgi:NADH-quinone oxidoreductase subunit F